MKLAASLPEAIGLFTDFGEAGPYLGQMEAVLHLAGTTQPVIRLVSDAPACNPRSAAYLLAGLVRVLPQPTLFLAVVDPGVGGSRSPLMLRADRHCFVGPDNGLFSQVMQQAEDVELQIIEPQDRPLSASFHGRDLFAPVAAALARGGEVSGRHLPAEEATGMEWPCDLHEVVYIDHYGNAFTGIRAAAVAAGTTMLSVGNITVPAAGTFSEVPAGQPFWYCNSMGLVEIAVNQGRADEVLGLHLGDTLVFSPNR